MPRRRTAYALKAMRRTRLERLATAMADRARWVPGGNLAARDRRVLDRAAPIRPSTSGWQQQLTRRLHWGHQF